MTAKYNLIVVLGPTASGKTKLAVKLAKNSDSEIISADSRQVYRKMDMGTGKDLEEFKIDGKTIPYHLIDIVDPDYEFNVFEYQQRFFACFSEISSRGILPIMVGGTGLYIESALKGYRMFKVPEDPSLKESLQTKDLETLAGHLTGLNHAIHNTTDLKDKKRLIRAIEIAEYSRNHHPHELSIPLIKPFIIGIKWDRATLRRKIAERLEERLKTGMIEEVKGLHASGISFKKLEFFGLEYRYLSLYLQGELNYNDMFQKLRSSINQFAKRQETWFRRMEKQGFKINWINGSENFDQKNLVDHLKNTKLCG